MESILLVGGGGHCKSVIDVIEAEGRFEIAGIVDKPALIGTTVLGYEVLGSDEDLGQLSDKYQFALVTVGQIKSPNIRMVLFKRLQELGFNLPTIISPRAYVAKSASVGDGSVVMHDALLNSSVVVGKNCIINTKSLVEHDSTIASHCHVSTGAIINGHVYVGGESFVGSHATTRESITIEKGSFVKAGSIVK